MTPQERRTPKILNGSRRMRIAKGSGVTVTEVNNLVESDEDTAEIVRDLEERYDDMGEGDALVEEVEQFLRDNVDGE